MPDNAVVADLDVLRDRRVEIAWVGSEHDIRGELAPRFGGIGRDLHGTHVDAAMTVGMEAIAGNYHPLAVADEDATESVLLDAVVLDRRLARSDDVDAVVAAIEKAVADGGAIGAHDDAAFLGEALEKAERVRPRARGGDVQALERHPLGGDGDRGAAGFAVDGG